MNKTLFCIGKLIVVALVVSTVFVPNIYAASKNVIYELKDLGKQKIKVSLLDAQSRKEANVYISFYYFKNGKTLVVGYKEASVKNKLSSVSVSTASAILPIRVILAKDNDKENPPFNDVKGLESEEFIRHLHDFGVLSGDKNNNFKPLNTITRAEFCSMLTKGLNLKPKDAKKLPFKDISKHWAKTAIIAANQNGYLSGFSDRTFKPDNKLSVAECSVIISKAFKFKTKYNGLFTKLTNGKWYTQGIKKLFDAGVITAKDGIYKDFYEDRPIKRGEAAMILSRALSTY